MESPQCPNSKLFFVLYLDYPPHKRERPRWGRKLFFNVGKDEF